MNAEAPAPKFYRDLMKAFDQAVDDWPRDREVCARRARELRKRGEDIRFAHFTCNGKARYLWIAARPRWPKARRPWSSARAALMWSWKNEQERRAAWLKRATPYYQDFLDKMLGKVWAGPAQPEPETIHRVDEIPADFVAESVTARPGIGGAVILTINGHMTRKPE